MPEPADTRGEPNTPPTQRPHQFSLRRLLMVMVAVSAIYVLGRLLNVHAASVLTVAVLTAAMLQLTPSARRVMWQMFACAYLPYAWLLLYLRTDYHIYWLKLWPVLPGILTSAVVRMQNETVELMLCGLVSVVLIGLATLLGTRDKLRRPVTIVVLVLSLVNAWIAHAAFRA